MGDYKAGLGLVLTVIGYLVLFGVLSLTQLIAYDSAQVIGFDYTNLTATGIGGSVFSGACELPRYIVNPVSGESNEVSWNRDSARCEYTIGSLSESYCEDIAGCSWVNASSFLWFFETSAYCDGYINLTNYTDYTTQTEDNPLPATLTSNEIHVRGANTFYDTDGDGDYKGENFCALFNEQDTCELFGCTYISAQTQAQQFNELSSAQKIANTIKDVFTFQVDLGLDGESDYWVSIIFWLLNVLILVQLYFILPFFH